MAISPRFVSHPQSAPGDFYVVNQECVACGAPHAVAPDLIGWAKESDFDHCIWKKQPETVEELEQAFAAFDASCIAAYRYAGSDPAIISRLGADHCDQADLATQFGRTQALSPAPPPLAVALSFTVARPTVFARILSALVSRFRNRA